MIKNFSEDIIVLAEALYAYGKVNDRRGLELLGTDFDANDYKMMGASDEQLDVFNDVWYTMLLNTGEAMKGKISKSSLMFRSINQDYDNLNIVEVIEKQIKKREGIPFLWGLLERGYKLANRPEASVANEKARALECAYFHERNNS